jgi:hypothetical protein
MDVLLLIAGLIFVLFIYFIPAYVAYSRDHPQRHWILVCNLFAGATIIDGPKDSEADA